MATAVVCVMVTEAAFLGAVWAIGWLLVGRTHRLVARRPDSAPLCPRLSVIIPARNEQARLPELLRALTRMSLHEVIVVDDDSDDATAAVADSFGVTVVPVGPPPAGWTGKAWACRIGAARADGDVIVFLDADVEPSTEGLEALAGAAWSSGGLVSVQPAHRVERLHEYASAGPVLVTMLGAGTGEPRGHRHWRRPIAFGPAMAINRTAYWSFGGHTSASGSVDDDLALARAADAAALPVAALVGGELIRYRMYPGGIAQLVEGWTKNLATGADHVGRLRLAASVLWVSASLSAAIVLVREPSPATALVYVAFAHQAHILLRRACFGPRGLALLYPFALLGFLYLFTASAIATKHRRSVRWRGRDIAVGRPT